MSQLCDSSAQCDMLLRQGTLTRADTIAIKGLKAQLLAREAKALEVAEDPRDLGFGSELFGGFNQRAHTTPVVQRRVVGTVKLTINYTRSRGPPTVLLPIVYNSIESMKQDMLQAVYDAKTEPVEARPHAGSVLDKAVSRFMSGWPKTTLACQPKFIKWQYYTEDLSLSPYTEQDTFYF